MVRGYKLYNIRLSSEFKYTTTEHEIGESEVRSVTRLPTVPQKRCGTGRAC